MSLTRLLRACSRALIVFLSLDTRLNAQLQHIISINMTICGLIKSAYSMLFNKIFVLHKLMCMVYTQESSLSVFYAIYLVNFKIWSMQNLRGKRIIPN